MNGDRKRSANDGPDGAGDHRASEPGAAARLGGPVCDVVTCPLCAVAGVEKKQKWFCPRCGQLLQTCCD